MNPYLKAYDILSQLAWIEGAEPAFEIDSIEFSPVAAESWQRCCDAVAELPDAENGSWMCIVARLKTRFDRTESRGVGVGSAGVLWRWLNPPSGPWITPGELRELRGLASLQSLSSEQIPSASANKDVEQLEQPKIKLPENEAISAVWNAYQKAAAGDRNVSQICRRIAPQFNQKPESLRAQFNRWKRENKLKL
jgi:hypothetical protein